MINNNARHILAATCLGFFIFMVMGIFPAYAEESSGMMASGDAAITAFSGVISQANGVSIDMEGPSVRIINLPGSGPFGLIEASKSFTATARSVGQVFGIALDNQSPPNIFVAATSAYGISIYRPNTGRLKRGAPGAQFMPGQFGPADQEGGPHSIWRIDGQTGAVSLFANVENDETKTTPAALGGLAFDAMTQQLFVADRATGWIHRYSMDGVDHGVFDHGIQGRTAAGQEAIPFDASTLVDINSPSFDTENPNTWGYAPESRRVFALAVHQQRLYYSVFGSQIWSVGIIADGSFASDARMEVSIPAQSSGSEIASITFDAQGLLYAAERGAPTGDFNFLNLANSGQNRVKRFAPASNMSSSDRWVIPGSEYAIGMPSNYQNANGGVALNCGQTVWSTGERLLDPGDLSYRFPYIDGLQGNQVDLIEPANMPPLKSWFVNYYDYQANPNSRGHMGAVAILKICGGSVYVPPPVNIGYTCPPGTFLMNGNCMLPPVCPYGTIFRNGYCIYADCPQGYIRIRHHKECVRPPRHCPVGTVFINDRCVPVGCPPRLALATNGYCHCPRGQTYIDGRCIPPHHCPRGQTYIDGRCIPPHHCPRGQAYIDGRCIPPHHCPRGQTYVGGRCIPPHHCPRGQTYIDGRCIMPPHACPRGQTYMNGRCIPPHHCKRDQVLRDGRCIDINHRPLCKRGQVIREGHCVTIRNGHHETFPTLKLNREPHRTHGIIENPRLRPAHREFAPTRLHRENRSLIKNTTHKRQVDD